LEKIAGIARHLQMPVGIFAASANVVSRLVKLDFTFFLVGGDAMALASGAIVSLEESRRVIRQAKI